jgi:hypothetical protein
MCFLLAAVRHFGKLKREKGKTAATYLTNVEVSQFLRVVPVILLKWILD